MRAWYVNCIGILQLISLYWRVIELYIDIDGIVDCVESGLENIFFCQQSIDFNHCNQGNCWYEKIGWEKSYVPIFGRS